MVEANILATLIDQFKVEQHLGATPYTDVYLAYDVDNDVYVSLHIVRAEWASAGDFNDRLISRAKAIAQVRHPNIARVYQVGITTTGVPYVAQEHIDGLSLAQRLEQLVQRQTPVNSIYALKLVRQLADALNLAERLTLGHYDLQPANVRLKNVALPDDDTVVLLDLFIPAGMRAPTPVGRNESAAAYLSPEQRAGKEITAGSHVFSLGVLLFRLLSGHLPSRPVSLTDTFAQTVFSRPTALERIRPELSPELKALVDRSLRRDSGQRYRTMADFTGALDSALAAEENRLGTPAGQPEEPRRRLAAFLLPILVMGLMLLAGAFAVRQFGVWSVAANGANVPPTVAPTALQPVASPTESVMSLDPVLAGTAEQGSQVILLEATTVTPASQATQTINSPSPSPAISPTATPTATTPPANTPSPTPETFARIAFNAVNMRRGPGIVYPTIGTVVAGERLKIIARNADAVNLWYLIMTEDDRTGWIAAEVLEPLDEASQAVIPEAATIPPTPVFTATPSPTATLEPATPIPTVPLGGGNEPQATQSPPKPPPEPTLTPPALP